MYVNYGEVESRKERKRNIKKAKIQIRWEGEGIEEERKEPKGEKIKEKLGFYRRELYEDKRQTE